MTYTLLMCVDIPQYQTGNTVQTIICHSKTFPWYCFENWLFCSIHIGRPLIRFISYWKIVRRMHTNCVLWIGGSRTRTHTEVHLLGPVLTHFCRTRTHAKWSTGTQVSCTHPNPVNCIYWIDIKVPQKHHLNNINLMGGHKTYTSIGFGYVQTYID